RLIPATSTGAYLSTKTLNDSHRHLVANVDGLRLRSKYRRSVLPRLTSPPRERAMDVSMCLIDLLPSRALDPHVTFHLLQPVALTPVAPHQHLPRFSQVPAKEIGSNVQEAVPVSLPSVSGPSVEGSRPTGCIVKVDLTVLCRQAETLDQTWRWEVEP